MRSTLLAPVLAAIAWLAPASAVALSCAGPEFIGRAMLPSDGAIDVPTNLELWGGDELTLVQLPDRVVIPRVGFGDLVFAEGTLSRTRPDRRLAPETEYVLESPAAEGFAPRVAVRFRTAGGPDEQPPPPPRFRIEAPFQFSYACGRDFVVHVESEAAMVALVGTELDGPLGSRELFDLFLPPRRDYRLVFLRPQFDARLIAFDLAGNVSEPSEGFTVRTHVPGCSTSEGACFSAFPALLVLRARRRRDA